MTESSLKCNCENYFIGKQGKEKQKKKIRGIHHIKKTSPLSIDVNILFEFHFTERLHEKILL